MTTPFGAALRDFRAERRMSQLALALEADISARHVSFLETGRASPSREMVARLADTLALDLRARSVLYAAAGYASPYEERPLAAEDMAIVRDVLERMLAAQAPYPALVFDRRWRVILANPPFRALMEALGVALEPGRTDLLELVLAPGPLRDALEDWETSAVILLQRRLREAGVQGGATRERARLEALAERAGAPPDWRTREVRSDLPVLPVTLALGGARLSFITTAAAFGAPCDVTAQELTIELFHPADAETQAFLEKTAA